MLRSDASDPVFASGSDYVFSGNQGRTRPRSDYDFLGASTTLIKSDLNCCIPVERNYYKNKVGPVCCLGCGVSLSPEQLATFKENFSKYSSIHPSCGDNACGETVFGKERAVSVAPPKRKRKRAAAKKDCE